MIEISTTFRYFQLNPFTDQSDLATKIAAKWTFALFCAQVKHLQSSKKRYGQQIRLTLILHSVWLHLFDSVHSGSDNSIASCMHNMNQSDRCNFSEELTVVPWWCFFQRINVWRWFDEKVRDKKKTLLLLRCGKLLQWILIWMGVISGGV